MNKAQAVSPQEIIEYYETCEEHYSLLWHLNTHMAMHYGYWDKNTANLKEALFNLNDLLAKEAQLDSSKSVLDAGCGVGGSSVYIARKYGCKAHGITLSNKHAAFASKMASAEGLNATFSVADFTNTPFANESFDVVWAIESVCHANEKADFLKEAFRVLKKGGRLVLVDFFRTMEQPDAKEAWWLNNWARTWAIPHYEYAPHFERKANEAGFKQLDRRDITKNIRRSAWLLYLYFYPGLMWNYFLKLIGKHKSTHIENIWSAFYQFHALRKGYWNYELVTAIK